MGSDCLYFLYDHVIMLTTHNTRIYRTCNAFIFKALDCLDVPPWELEPRTSVKGEYGLHTCASKHKPYWWHIHLYNIFKSSDFISISIWNTRLDFNNLVVANPNAVVPIGTCVNDIVKITSASSTGTTFPPQPPLLCGVLTGSHGKFVSIL